MKNKNLDIAIKVARKAGKFLLSAYNKNKNIEIKGDRGIVTEADKQSELLIKRILSKTGHGFLGEESGIDSKTDTFWVVDPLDGTSNFANNIPNFCVSIALMEKGSVKVGVIYSPTENQLFYAVQGEGAYMNDKPIHVSTTDFSINSLVLTTHGYAEKDRKLYVSVVKKLVTICMLRKLGSTALDLCKVAKGSADAFIGSGDELWDYAAAVLIVKEAGGIVTDWEGKVKKTIDNKILATNRNAHSLLVNLLSK